MECLADNDCDDPYLYKVTVVTALRRRAGTSSKVFFVLYGRDGDTGRRALTGYTDKVWENILYVQRSMKYTRPISLSEILYPPWPIYF